MTDTNITKDMALNNIKGIANMYRGTKDEHIAIQQSISLIEELIADKPKHK